MLLAGSVLTLAASVAGLAAVPPDLSAFSRDMLSCLAAASTFVLICTAEARSAA